MRNKTIIIVMALSGLFFLQNCKHDPALSSHSGQDPDSLYVGTPYTIPAFPSLMFPYRTIAIPSDNPMTVEGIRLGRMLFYDSTLSLTKQISCGSCHKQQYAFGDNTPLSQNVLGPTKRNTATLINMGMNTRFFWDGRRYSVEEAVKDALNGEQHPDFTYAISYLNSTPIYTYLFRKAFGRPGDITEDKVEKAIAQFLRTITSTNSRIDRYYRGEAGGQLTAEEDAGRLAFFDNEKGDCAHCHNDGRYLTFAIQDGYDQFANNAIDSATNVSQFADKGLGGITGNSYDIGRFKTPTLRNVEVSAPYMHDGRFAALDQIIGHYSDSLYHSPTVNPNMTHLNLGGLHLDAQGKANILAFLRALTDTTYLHNPAYSNPFH